MVIPVLNQMWWISLHSSFWVISRNSHHPKAGISNIRSTPIHWIASENVEGGIHFGLFSFTSFSTDKDLPHRHLYYAKVIK